ncbi:rhodanese-like domain-containing protein [Microcella humidisoli]|jgi:rhodanese-related sulfurtransferase|uniref:Rhodanese-like domain-containing protein n=1 Tax=Microcella humidisoli TaxID=2963406 RepID=A0ABY5FV99_9MICO|nr:rhodanese-like domain-containing protein [Microcella humidisoli]UTT62047.1 rhodanese-like domain-containing protein [Microcella humidisoli]
MADEITVDQLVLERERGATVIDVREVDEYIAAHVPGVRLVPLGTIPDALDALPRDETVYIICHSGARSLRAADFLNAQGFDAVSVAGGTSAWVQRGLDYATGDDR